VKHLRPYQQKALQECWEALKTNDEPVLLYASVGAGKSLMLSELLLKFEHSHKRALCIVNNAELVRNNAETYRQQGGNPSLYCNALNIKDTSQCVIFGTPQSVLNGIKRQRKIGDLRFHIILVDEAHAIDYQNHRTTFMRILRHYKETNPSMRVLGATGTCFRYKGESIVGEKCLFKKQVGNITTAWLIENNYLVKPIFEVNKKHEIDFSQVRLNSMGKFDVKQLEETVHNNHRLTGKILLHLQHIMASQNRFGCFIFCCTKAHCYEALNALPAEQSAVITAETPQKDRLVILDRARKGEIKYLINVQVLTVGIDVPGYDTLLFLRPTESLVLAVQMIGRALRLYPGKESALILDCAGNLERHKDWDDPIILDAIKQIYSDEKDLIFPCPECETLNSAYARRCVGIVNNKRCEFYFEWKNCTKCDAKNDIAARYCRYCEAELLDPNRNLTDAPFKSQTETVTVIQAKYWLQHYDDRVRLSASYNYAYEGKSLWITESYSPQASDKAKNLFYGKFVKDSVPNPSFWYPHLQNNVYLKAMLQYIRTPTTIILRYDNLKWSIWKKEFADNQESPFLPPQIQQTIHNDTPAAQNPS